ncbi:MAG: NAD(P)/FAD-dependent oxidoreductase [Dehalococcoidia bacterium]|nr:NAD(P)/FAD-dependent oxidoreductase [Dehalococcoidia bacterium]
MTPAPPSPARPADTFDADVVVIGAGVVGLAVAERLARSASVVVLERHEGIARETSAHNSGVVHASIYYETGSLKHRLCWEGNPLIYEWADAHHVPVLRCGKLIAAMTEEERPGLDEVLRQATANEARDLQRLSGEQARALEPHVPVVEAIWSPSTGVVDAFALARSYEAAARAHGALTVTHHEVTHLEREGAGFRLALRDAEGATSELRAGTVVNSAGLHAHHVAEMLDYPLDGGFLQDGAGQGVPVPALRQRVNRGVYYDIVDPEVARRISRPVYPLPEHAAGGLGLHLTVDTDGGVHLGPAAEWIEPDVPLDYRNPDNPALRARFLASGQRFLPGLRDDQIAPGQVGYRPKLQAPGGGQADFLIWRHRGYVHLGGIESPGLTSSLALAREVEKHLR